MAHLVGTGTSTRRWCCSRRPVPAGTSHSKEWQEVFESFTFKDLVITPWRLPYVASIITAKRLKYLDFANGDAGPPAGITTHRKKETPHQCAEQSNHTLMWGFVWCVVLSEQERQFRQQF